MNHFGELVEIFGVLNLGAHGAHRDDRALEKGILRDISNFSNQH
jgi:hypothetical protein